MRNPRRSVASTGRLLLLGTTMTALSLPAAHAQSDLPVTTQRYKQSASGVDAQASDVVLSKQPRYYLDTIDNLNRLTSDQTRPAPGLAKNNYIAKSYKIENAQAIEIQSYLLRSLAYEGGVVEVMGADGVKDESGKTVQYLFVTAPDFMIPGITEMVEQCDRPGFKFFDATGLDFGGGPGAVSYVGKHRTASELTAILAGTELGNVGAFLFPPFADDSTNTIYIVENPTDIADDLAALEMFDQPPLQIELEVNIYEIDEGNAGKLGLDWDAWKSFIGGQFTYESTAPNTFFDSDTDIYSTLLTLDAGALADFLNYTVQTGTARVVTSTNLTVVNSEDNPGALSGGARGTATGTPAVIESMTAIPFTAFNYAGDSSVDGTNGRNETPMAAEEGIRVEILPFIATESITLKVNAEVHSLIGYTPKTDYPMISSRTVNSVVNLRDGEPVVLGGLERTHNVESRVGLPLLKDIPLLGYVFGKESTDKTTSKVLISLRPRVKTTDSEQTATLF